MIGLAGYFSDFDIKKREGDREAAKETYYSKYAVWLRQKYSCMHSFKTSMSPQ